MDPSPTGPETLYLRDDSLPGTQANFVQRFSDEQACADVLRRWKYHERGFACPCCGYEEAWFLPSRRLAELPQAMRAHGYEHRPANLSKSSEDAHEILPAIHRVFSLLHRVLLGTYQGGVRRKHLPRYLAEFEFRFYRRNSSQHGLLFQRVLSCATRRVAPYHWEIVGRESARMPLRLAG